MSPDAPRAQRWGPTLLIAAAFGLYFFLSRPPSAPAGWENDFQVASKNAAATQKPMIIAFHLTGCPPCEAMDRTVLGEAAVRDALVGFVPLRVHTNREGDLADRYRIFATPTYVVTKDGQELARREGYLSIAELVAFLNENAPRVATIPNFVAPSSTGGP